MRKITFTVYDKSPKPYDLICHPGYMLAGFRVGAILNMSKFEHGGITFDLFTKISTIGRLVDGRKSAGFKVFETDPPGFVTFAGRFDDMALFHSHVDDENLQWMPPGPGKTIKRTKYFQLYLAFHIMPDGTFLYITNDQASRVVSTEICKL